jgi:hypothetical protein
LKLNHLLAEQQGAKLGQFITVRIVFRFAFQVSGR